MSSWNRTDLECSNREVVKTCASIPCISINGVEEKYWDSETKIRLYTANSCPEEEIIEISKLFPDDVITCHYFFDSDDYTKVYVVEYLNGKQKNVDLKPGYHVSCISSLNEKDGNRIWDKVHYFCRKLDTVEENLIGDLFINWFPAEVCFKFMHHGEDGKQYRVEATKNHDFLDYEVSEGSIEHDWREKATILF